DRGHDTCLRRSRRTGAEGDPRPTARGAAARGRPRSRDRAQPAEHVAAPPDPARGRRRHGAPRRAAPPLRAPAGGPRRARALADAVPRAVARQPRLARAPARPKGVTDASRRRRAAGRPWTHRAPLRTDAPTPSGEGLARAHRARRPALVAPVAVRDR